MHRLSLSLALAALLAASPLAAKVTADEAARLGKDLTPVGAERAGNRDGSIPSWAPGKRRGALAGEYPSAPLIDGESPLFVITPANRAQYADRLTEGHRLLLSTYDSYKLPVYPSHRVVTWPDEIQKATLQNATCCALLDPDTPDQCALGFPFPIPKSGAEPIWNHKLKWRGEAATRYNNQLIVQPGGSFQLTKIIEHLQFDYASIRNPSPVSAHSGDFLKYLSRTLEPPRLAGTFILLHESAGTGGEGRAAWLYSPALKRIRRAPTVCCDNPYEGSDGHQFYDQVDMFNGVLERYDWTLVGKKELFIPYNGNRIAGSQVKYAELARPRHLNQDLARYELHRVWIVEAHLRPGTSHSFLKRRFYIDEDSWHIVAVENYDNRRQLAQFQEGHLSFLYNVLVPISAPEVIYHFRSGRYFITAAFNEDKPYDFGVQFPKDYFTAGSVQKMSTR